LNRNGGKVIEAGATIAAAAAAAVAASVHQARMQPACGT